MTKKRPAFETNVQGREEAEETLRAIRDGAVDAFVVEEPEGHRVYTLEGVDLPYSILVERMQQGAAMLNARGDMIYCNPSLARFSDRHMRQSLEFLCNIFLTRLTDPRARRC